MSLLKINKLTMQFGGLKAVSEVDLDVPERAIFSVIGPNGAGKTTVFNAVTGIYQPTTGEICFAGHPLQRPLRWYVVLGCLVIGLFSGLAALLISIDVNALWRAVIVRNMEDPTVPFSWAEARHDFLAYFSGRLGVERLGPSRWGVVPWNDTTPLLAAAKTKVEAREVAALFDRVMNAETLPDSTPAEVRQEIVAAEKNLVKLRKRRDAQRLVEWISLLAAFLVASAGALVVWNRSRRTPDVIAGGGIARTFQNIRLFPSMTTLENVQVATDRAQGRDVRRLVVAAVVWLVVAGGLAWLIVPAAWPDCPPLVRGSLKLIAAGGELALLTLAHLAQLPGRAAIASRGLRRAWPVRLEVQGVEFGQLIGLRRPASAGDCPGAGPQAAAGAARRASGRDEPDRSDRADAADSRHSRDRRGSAPDRTSYERSDGHFRPDRRP